MNAMEMDLKVNNGKYAVGSFSGIGKRESQQDAAYCYARDGELFAVVCDGMGGLTDGALASRTAIGVAVEANRQHRQKKGMPGQENPDWLADMILKADQSVCMLKNKDGEAIKTGSTMAAVWIRENLLHWCSVGDSRLYLFRGSEVVQATTDLNYFFLLNQQLEEGSITQDKYRQEAANGEALISFCGLGNVSIIDRNVTPLHMLPGDVVLLCTDGLYRTIDEKWMQDILQACDSIEEAANLIPEVMAQHETSEQDNFTYIIIQMRK